MMYMRESGIIHYHMTDVIRRRTGRRLYGVFKEHDRPEEDVAIVLSINPLGACFATWILGLAIASLVFYRELHKTGKTLRDFQPWEHIRFLMNEYNK